MIKENLTIGGIACTAYHRGAPKYLLIQPEGGHDPELLDRETDALASATEQAFLFAAFHVRDWNRELSPWKAPAVFGKEAFGGGAEATVRFLLEELIPFLLQRYAVADETPVILGGYSLAALFSLWCACRTERFAAVAAASPSVWFDGWIEYAGAHRPRTKCVYLSLGDREEKAKNRILATVGSCIRTQAALLETAGIDCVLEWNEGNHFRDPDKRCAKGFAWCMNTLEDSEGRIRSVRKR